MLATIAFLRFYITLIMHMAPYIFREMGKILGVEVQLEYSNPHTQSNGSVDLKS